MCMAANFQSKLPFLWTFAIMDTNSRFLGCPLSCIWQLIDVIIVIIIVIFIPVTFKITIIINTIIIFIITIINIIIIITIIIIIMDKDHGYYWVYLPSDDLYQIYYKVQQLF